jgi:hypothetical protein
MAFPIMIRPKLCESEAGFVMQDPWNLRRSITPLFLVSGDDVKVIGLGTSFFVNGARCVDVIELVEIVRS